MRFIEYIEDFVPEDTDAPSYSTYPQTGIYRTKSNMYYLVNKEAYSVTFIGNTLNFSTDRKETSTINEDFVLKLIAVTSSPVLATQLIKGN
jgi:hypothetical protein